MKKQTYTGMYCNNYFWRTWSKQEIDWVEEWDGELHGYEFKWGAKSGHAAPKEWRAAYPAASYSTVNRENFVTFVT